MDKEVHEQMTRYSTRIIIIIIISSSSSIKLSLLRGLHPKSARASPQHLAHNIPNFFQIGSHLAEL